MGCCSQSYTRACELVGDTWLLLLVRSILGGEHRFTELHRTVNAHAKDGEMSTRTLVQRLRHMEEQGLLTRTGDTRPEYHLTEKGESLGRIIKDLEKFGETYLVI